MSAAQSRRYRTISDYARVDLGQSVNEHREARLLGLARPIVMCDCHGATGWTISSAEFIVACRLSRNSLTASSVCSS